MRLLLAGLALVLSVGVAQSYAMRAVCFIGPVFIAGVADGACLVGDGERLLDGKVVDWDRKPAPLVMRAEGDPKDTLVVSTCRQWLQAVSLSRAAMRAQDRARESFYERTCQTLDQLKFADPSSQAWMAANGEDLLKPALVPARLLELAGIKGPLAPAGASVADLAKAGELVIRDRKIGMMEVTWRNVDLALNPTGRGDFDRDGIEDLAIAMEVVLRGSRRAATMIVFLTRRSEGGPLEVTYPKPRG